MATEVILPRVFREHAFCSPAEQVAGINVDLPGKIFAVHSYDINTSKTRAEQLYSHLERGINNGHAANRQWTTARWYTGQSASDVANAVPSDKDFLYMSQIMEDRAHGGFIGDTTFMDQVFEQRFANTGQSDPANTNQIGDYFDHDGIAHIGLLSLTKPIGDSYWSQWRTRFSSESEARKDRDGVLSNFFSRGAGPYTNRNWQAVGYWDGWHRSPEWTHIYHILAEIEQKHLAVRRKVVQFAWDVLEGSEWKIYRHGSMQGIRFENPAGWIYKSTLNYIPCEMGYRQSLLFSVIGDGHIQWGPGGRNTSDISRWVRSYNGGTEAAKTQWKADNMSLPVTYNPNDSSMPAKSPGDNPTNQTEGNNVQIVPPSFGGPGPTGVHDALAGRYMHELIKTKMITPKYAPFTFKINGGSSQNGYFDGEFPVMGTLGDGSLSTLNNRNFGQHNIIRQLEYRLPICIEDGLPGNGVVIWCKPDAKITEVNEVTLDDGTVFEAIGPQMRVFSK